MTYESPENQDLKKIEIWAVPTGTTDINFATAFMTNCLVLFFYFLYAIKIL